MAFTKEGFMNMANARLGNEQPEEEQPKQEATASSVGNVLGGFIDRAKKNYLENASNVGNEILENYNTGTDVNGEGYGIPDYDNPPDEATPSITEYDAENPYGISPQGGFTDAAFRAAGQSFYNDEDINDTSSWANSLAQSAYYRDIIMTDSQKLELASKIADEIGIDSDILMEDKEAFNGAIKVYNTTQAERKLVPVGSFDMDTVWEQYPELANLNLTDHDAVKLALKEIDTTRTTHDVIEAFKSALNKGSLELEKNMLYYKDMEGELTEEDEERIRQIKNEQAAADRQAPSFLDDPLVSAISGVANSLPEMVSSALTPEVIRDAVIGAGAGLLLSEVTGGASIPVAAGTNAIRGIIMRRLLTEAAVKTGTKIGIGYGTYEAMAKPESGNRYEEISGMSDKNGNILMPDKEQRKTFATLGGELNAMLETANLGIIIRSMPGGSFFAKNAIADAMDAYMVDVAGREALLQVVKRELGAGAKITFSESGEEAMQSVSDDLIHNRIEAVTGDTSNKVYTAGDILGRAAKSFVESLPASIGFGTMPMLGNAFSMVRHARQRDAFNEAKGNTEAYKTVRGGIALEQLQQAVHSGDFNKVAPEKQARVLREQLNGSGMETTYIDVEMALQQEGGREDLEAVKKAANISDEDFNTALKDKGFLPVPTESYAQSDASPKLLDAVSFSQDGDSLARMRRDAAEHAKITQEAAEKAVKEQMEIINGVLDNYFPAEKEGSAELRDLARAIMMDNPDNPSAGWSALYDQLSAEKQEIIGPALNALKRGMKNGVSIIENEDGSSMRVSNNEKWYSDFYATYGRAPSNYELEEMASAMTVGDASAPRVEGWVPTDQATMEAMQEQKAHLDELNKTIAYMDQIKGTMKNLTASEINLTRGLSKEAVQVYEKVKADLAKGPARSASAARVGAILWARHADIAAEWYTRVTGKKYTALDLYNKMGGAIGSRAVEANAAAEQLRQEQAEIDQVRQQYEGTDKWMKAPNGKKTNLTERQWLQVRTPSFKKWFGDWENDPENASKVVDENGEPLVVYHGATESWSTYNSEKKKSKHKTLAADGNIYTSSSSDVAKTYIDWGNDNVPSFDEFSNEKSSLDRYKKLPTNYVMVVKISVNRKDLSLVVDENGELTGQEIDERGNLISSKTKISKAIKYKAANTDATLYRKQTHNGPYYNEYVSNGDLQELVLRANYYNFLKDHSNVPGSEVMPLFINAKQPLIVNFGGRPYYAKVNVNGEWFGNNDREVNAIAKIENYAKENQYDGIIARNVIDVGGNMLYTDDEIADTFVAFSPNQIKSATNNNGNFSLTDDNIYHQMAGIRGASRMDQEENPDNYYPSDLLEDAQDMQRAGESAEEIYKETGWLAGEQEARATADRAVELASDISFQHYLDSLANLSRDIGEGIKKEYAGRKDIDDNAKDIINKYVDDSVAAVNNSANVEPEALFEQLMKVDEDLAAEVREKVSAIDHWAVRAEIAENEHTSAVEAMERPHDFDAIVIFNGEQTPICANYNQTNSRNDVLFQGIKGAFTPAADIGGFVQIMEGADQSTFIHESAHMFLTDLERLAPYDSELKKMLDTIYGWAEWKDGAAAEYKKTPWAAEFADRERKIKEALASGNIEEADRLKRQWRHERFARGFETYLKEGKAPSKGLRSAFRAFARWLHQVYAAFVAGGQGENGRASAEVEAVMARLIATDEEIEQAALDDRYSSVIEKAGGDKLLNETDKQTYARWHKEAEEEAREKLRKIVMQDLEQAQRDKVEETVATRTELIRHRLQKKDIFMAKAAVDETGTPESALIWYPSVEEYEAALANEKPFEEQLAEKVAKVREAVEQQQIAEKLTDEAVTEAMESAAYHKKLVALETAAYAKRQALVNKFNKKTNDLLDSMKGELEKEYNPETAENAGKPDNGFLEARKNASRLRYSARWSAAEMAAIEAIMKSKTREEALVKLNEFQKLATGRKIDLESVTKLQKARVKEMTDVARKALSEMTIANATNVYAYRKEEKRHAAFRLSAIKKGDWIKAMAEQEQMLYNAALANEAAKIKADVKKLVDQTKRQLRARSVKLPVEEGYWFHHLAFLLRLSQQDAVKPKNGVPPLTKMFTSMADSLDITQDALDAYASLEAEDYKDYKSLTMQQFNDVAEVLKVLYNTGKDKFKLKTIGGKTIAEAVDDIIRDKSLADNIEVKHRRIEEDEGGMGYNDILGAIPGIGPAMAHMGQHFLALHLKPEEILNTLGKKAHDYIYGIYEHAANVEAEMTAKNVIRLQELLSVYSREEKKDWQKKKYQFKTADGTETMTKEMVLCMALNFGNSSNIQRLVSGLGTSELDVEKFLRDTLTAKDWAFVQSVWDYLSEYWPQTVEVEEKLNGVTLEKVEPKPFQMVDRETGEIIKMKGGYYPIAYNPEKSSAAADQNADAALKTQMSGAMVFGTHRGFSKSRKAAVNDRPLLLSFDVIPTHLSDVIHNISTRLAARDVYRLIKNKAFEAYVTETLGKEYHRVLDQWATNVWAQPNIDDGAANFLQRAAGVLRRNSTFAIMGYRLWPALENVSNIAAMGDKVGARKALAAVASFYADRAGNMELIQRLSPFMANRINSMDRDVRSMPGMFSVKAKPFEVLSEHAYNLMLYSDLALSAPLWCQAYKGAYPAALREVAREAQENRAKKEKLQRDRDMLAMELQKANIELNDVETEIANRAREGQEAGLDEINPFRVQRTVELDAQRGERKRFRDVTSRKLFEAERELDVAMDLPEWEGEELIKESRRRAAAEADKAIRDTFGSGTTKDLSALQRSSNEMVKLMTTFYSFFNTQFNALFEAYQQGSHKYGPGEKASVGAWDNISRWAPFAKAVMYRIVLASLIGSLGQFALGLKGSDDKDKKKKIKGPDGKEITVEVPALERFLKLWASNMLSMSTGGVVGLRDITQIFSNFFLDGQAYNKGGNVATAGASEIWRTIELIANKSKKDLEIQEKHAAAEEKEKERLKKMTPKQRREYFKKKADNEQYKKPDKPITYSEIAKHAGKAVSTWTAGYTGITNTLVDSVTSTMMYLNDSTGRYDPQWKNIIWSALFDKKPVEREIPTKPKAEPKKKKKGSGK